MMKLLMKLLIVFAAVVALGFWVNHSLMVSSNELAGNVERVTRGVEAGRWDSAYEQTVKLEQTWREKAKWWPTVMDHQEIDNIEFALARVREYVANKNAALALGQLSELKLMITHIPEKEAIRIKNIL